MSDLFPTFSTTGQVLARWWSGLWRRLRMLPFGPTTIRFDGLVVLRELASMLRSGVPLPQALAFLGESFGPRTRRHLDQVREAVEQGEPLSEALRRLPRRWATPSLRATVAAGERSGRLPDLLEELAGEHERLQALDRRARSFLFYPLVVLTIANAVVAAVGRSLMMLFEGLRAPLPLVTRIVAELWAPVAGWIALLLALLTLYQLWTTFHQPRLGAFGGSGWRLASRLPLVSGLSRALVEVRFARTLRVLLSAGIPLPEALDLCHDVVGDDDAGVALVAASREIRSGGQPSDVLGGLSFLSPAFLWFLAGSEARGDFLDVTHAMAEAAEERFLTRAEILERVLEPAGTLVLGLIVGFVIVACYMPMFRMIVVVGN